MAWVMCASIAGVVAVYFALICDFKQPQWRLSSDDKSWTEMTFKFSIFLFYFLFIPLNLCLCLSFASYSYIHDEQSIESSPYIKQNLPITIGNREVKGEFVAVVLSNEYSLLWNIHWHCYCHSRTHSTRCMECC